MSRVGRRVGCRVGRRFGTIFTRDISIITPLCMDIGFGLLWSDSPLRAAPYISDKSVKKKRVLCPKILHSVPFKLLRCDDLSGPLKVKIAYLFISLKSEYLSWEC